MDGALWLHGGGDVHRIEGSDFKHILEGSSIHNIKKIDNDIWALSYDGAFRIRGDTYIHFLEGERIVDMHAYGESIYIASSIGCYRVTGDTVRRISNMDMAVNRMLLTGSNMWISTEQGDGYRIQGEEVQRLTTPSKTPVRQNYRLGDGSIQLYSKLVSISAPKIDEHKISFDLGIELRFVNMADHPGLIWDTDTYGADSRFCIGYYGISLTREDALSGRSIHSFSAWPSNYWSPKWRDWRCILDKAEPPEELIRILNPGENWMYQKYDTSISFDLKKRPTHTISNNWAWDQIKGRDPLWLIIRLEAWPINLDHERNGPNFLYFGNVLRRRWQPYGMLQLGYLTSEPIPLTLPEQ